MTTQAAGHPSQPMPEQSAAAPIERSNLKTQVTEVIRTAIFSGEFQPGVVYKNGELAARYGVSRTPVREAILELESKGLVSIARGVGFRVNTPTAAESREVTEIRQVLEGWAMGEVAGRMTDEALNQAELLLDRVTQAAESSNLATYWSHDRAFHDYLVRQAGNERVAALLAEYRDTQRIPVLGRIAREGSLPDRNKDHIQLLQALRAGDADLASRLIREHIGLNLED
jgi:DNA-binding GntR family transcriptional regulator